MAVRELDDQRQHRRLAHRFSASGAGWVVSAFLTSRVLAALAGVRFDDQWLPMAWQFIDTDLLENDLVTSVWLSHTQPPLFNLGLGLVLKFSPLPTAVSFQMIFLALGLVLALTVLALARALGCRRTTSIIVAIVTTCSPATLLYENWLFYTYPTTVLVTFLALTIERWVRTGKPLWFIGICVIAGTVALTQALFHPVWFVAVVVLAWLARRPSQSRTAAIAVAALVLALLLVVVVKNQVVAGVPGTSSWSGMNLFRVTVEQLPADERDALVADGELSELSTVPSFSNYADYEPFTAPCEPSSGAPILAESVKSTRYVNFNYQCFGPIFRQAQDDALVAIREDPGAAARAQVASWQLSFMPTGDYQSLTPNRPALQSYDDLYRSIVLLTVPLPPFVELPSDIGGLYADDVPFSVTIVIALVVLVVATFRALGRWRRAGSDSVTATTVYIGLTTAFVFVAGNAFEIGENNRFRSAVEPLMFVVLAAAIDRWLVRRKATAS